MTFKKPNLMEIMYGKDYRIKELERDIPQLERRLEETPRNRIREYASLLMKIEEHKLEYQERTGSQYSSGKI